MAVWLRGYGGFSPGDSISVDTLAPQPESYGLRMESVAQKSGFVSGGGEYALGFWLTARRSSQTEGLRAANQEWMEGLCGWVAGESEAGRTPELPGGRICWRARMEPAYELKDVTDMETVYRARLRIEYTEG